jgi:peptide/nickel transport system ATP-binding protein/oligopeptide transport system ATP-binding protein
MRRYPHEFSGGQRQRISIARALTLSPDLIVADEPLSSLDVSIQAQILNLLWELKQKMRLSFIFISHDLNVVHYFADIVAVMHAGRIVEMAEAERIFQNPKHPYTETLLEAIPKIKVSAVHHSDMSQGGKRRTSHASDQGDPSSKGCSFYGRCPRRLPQCQDESPPFRDVGDRKITCHLY